MPNYRVAWEIDIFDAPDPKTAARRALEIQKKRGNGPLLPDDATVFSVIDQEGDGEAIQIDLSNPSCEQCDSPCTTTQSDGSLVCDECGHVEVPWPWCDACQSYHHPNNVTCKLRETKDGLPRCPDCHCRNQFGELCADCFHARERAMQGKYSAESKG